MLQLSYSAQMTGWQSADGHVPPTCQQNHEVMELSRIVSQLAMANHQLASAHNATLARMEALYLELSREREDRKRAGSTEALEICDDILRKKLERRVGRLESSLATSCTRQCRRRGSLEDDRELRSRIERLERLLETRESKDDGYSRSGESRCESPERRIDHAAIDAVSEVPEDHDENRGATTEATDVHRCYDARSDDTELNIFRIDESERSADIDSDRTRKRRAKLRDDEPNSTRNLTGEEIPELLEEIERLKADRLECQTTNEKLLSNLADHKNMVEKLNGDYEVR